MSARRRDAGFASFWTASTVSAFGTSVTAVALPILVIDELSADPIQVGIVNAAQFVPYALLGLIAGVFVDRWRRRRTLVLASVGRASALAGATALWAVGALTVWTLVPLLLLFGSFSVFAFAASQSLLPRVVPRDSLLRANARLDQGDAVAQLSGPVLGGLLVRTLGAPLALLVDAATFVAEAVLIGRIRVIEATRRTRGRVGRDIIDGLRATYRHPVLMPLSLSTHVWFIANAASVTVLALLALRTLELGPTLFGFLTSAVGAATLSGALVAERLGLRLGEGGSIALARTVYPIVWAGIAAAGASRSVVPLFLLAAASGLAAGVENANELSYRQRAVPDELLGRVNATGRAVNRTAGAFGAVLGGGLVAWVGVVGAALTIAALFAVAAVIANLPSVRRARA